MSSTVTWLLVGIALMVGGFSTWTALVLSMRAFVHPVWSAVALAVLMIGGFMTVWNGVAWVIDRITS